MINIINSKTIKTMYNIFKINTMTAIIIAICLLSLAGIPPLRGFIPKLIIIFKLIETNCMILLFLLIGAYINLYYYLNITFNLIIRRNNIPFNYKNYHTYNLPMIAIISTSILGILPLII
jgi:NADH-quinone oxidoreductase subunit N